MEQSVFFTLAIIVVAWLGFYIVAVALGLKRFGVEVHPLFVMYKSTGLNSFLRRVGGWRPGLWRVVGNVGVVFFFGQVAFMSYILFRNLYNFLYVPREASPVMPLIPGVTISFQSLPWFLAAAGVVILLHELGHGVQCVVEGVRVKSAALLLAVLTFGGAVEPDEESMEAAGVMSKLRIFAIGSLINLMTGLFIAVVFFLAGDALPEALGIFLHWLYFLSINLALVNMLPVYPLDGGQMVRTYMETRSGWGKTLERAAMFCFLGLMVSNLLLSLARFGFIPL